MTNRNDGAKTRVLLIYRVMIPSIRLCGHCQLESLRARGVVEYRDVQEMKLSAEDLNWAQVVVLGRLDSWYELQLAKRVKQTGRYVIYILDDDLLNISPEVSSAAYYAQPQIRENIRSMIELSDAILTPSPLLAEKYARDGRRALMTEEPALDPIPFEPHAPDAPVKIGFAGSIDRTSDLEAMLGDVLTRLRAEYGDGVQFEFFGAKPEFIERLGARHIPYRDSYDEYRDTLNRCGWDIGLAPLPVTDFNACKHYNKFSEYAAAGVVGVYSDCLPYTRIPDRERYGLFCPDDSGAWYAALRGLIEDRERRETLRRRCAECAAEQLNVDLIADRLWADLEPVPKGNGSGEISAGGLRVLKIKNLFYRGVDIWRRYGIKALFWWIRGKLGRVYRKFVPKR